MTPTTRTTDDLRRSLHEAADTHPAPAPGDLLRDLRTERARRRRAATSRGAVAAAAAVVVAAGGAQLLRGDPAPAPPPAEGTASTVERGWMLDDRRPPEQADGLVRLETVAVPYTGADELTLPAAEGAGDESQRFAVLWCETGPDDAAITPPSLRLRTSDDEVVEVPCLPEDRDPSQVTVTPVPLPPGDEVTLEPAWQGDVPSRGEAVLGVYREASSAEYDFPGWPDPPLSPPTHGPDAVVIDPTSATGLVDGSASGGGRAATVVLTADSSLELWRGVPGGLQVDVDGVRVTDDGDAAGDAADGAWPDADPELRDGVWTAFTAGQRRSLPLPEEVLPEPGESRAVTVTVVPRAGAERWQVAVLGTAGASEAVPPTGPATGAPGTSGDLSEWYAGHRLVATWPVPRTGVATDLELPDALTQESVEVTWALRCSSSATRDGGVLATGRITVDDVTLERACTSGADEALYPLAESAGYPGTEVGPDSTVRVAVPEDPEGGALVAAYVPVPFADFDFAAAKAPLQWNPTAAVRGGTEVGQTVDAAELTDGTSTTVELSPSTVGVRVTTEGVGRVRLLLDGSPAEGPAVDDEGWWTSWTDDRVTAVPLAWVEQLRRDAELGIEVDGYPDGSVEVEVLVGQD